LNKQIVQTIFNLFFLPNLAEEICFWKIYEYSFSCEEKPLALSIFLKEGLDEEVYLVVLGTTAVSLCWLPSLVCIPLKRQLSTGIFVDDEQPHRGCWTFFEENLVMKASKLIKLWLMVTAFWGVFIFGYSIGKDGSLSSYYLYFWLLTSFTIFVICWLTILLMRSYRRQVNT